MENHMMSVVSLPLPVDEVLEIKKSRFMPKDGGNGKRISIVTGIHGDELEGQYVCYEVAKRIKENPQFLKGTVDIYPAMNPLGIDSITRGIPGFDLDMNRIFPGTVEGSFTEYIAKKIIEDLEGSDLCMDIHASNIYLTEIPQVRINELHQDKLVPLAKKSNVDFIWVHGANTVLESTLAYTLNSRGIPTLVAEMGVGMRLTEEYGKRLAEGLFSLMSDLGIWTGPIGKLIEPVISTNGNDVNYLNSPKSGIFMKTKKHGSHLKAGEVIGNILNPFTGDIVSAIKSPVDGWLFTIREYPVVDEGSLLARILADKKTI